MPFKHSTRHTNTHGSAPAHGYVPTVKIHRAKQLMLARIQT